MFLNQQRFKNLQPSPIVVTANDLRVVKVNPIIWIGLQVSFCILKSLVTFDALLHDLLNCVAFARCRRHCLST